MLEIDLASPLAEQHAALAVGEIGDLGQHRAPQLLLRRRVVDEIEELLGRLFQARQHDLVLTLGCRR